MSTNVRSLEQLLDRIEKAGGGRVSVEEAMEEVGRRSFGPMLLLPGIVLSAPLVGDIPGVPTMMGLFVTLVAAQFLFGRESPWFPRWLLERSVARAKVKKALRYVRPVARFVDRWSGRRLEWLVQDVSLHAIAVACIVMGLTTPLMEVVPFSAQLAGAAIAIFGISLVVHDGLFAAIGFVVTFGLAAIVIYTFV
jgi:hypothetical protein